MVRDWLRRCVGGVVTTLREQIAERLAASKETEEARAVRLRAIQEVRDGGQAPGLAVGDTIPPFSLPDAHGRVVSSEELLDKGPLVISFYRGDWCPYCNLELRALETSSDDIAALGASVVAISGQRPDAALGLTEKHELSFPVLSDVDQVAIRAFKLRYEIPAELREMYEARGADMAKRNADGSWTLPVSATYVTDSSGEVVLAHNDPDWRTRLEPTEILRALASLHDR